MIARLSLFVVGIAVVAVILAACSSDDREQVCSQILVEAQEIDTSWPPGWFFYFALQGMDCTGTLAYKVADKARCEYLLEELEQAEQEQFSGLALEQQELRNECMRVIAQ